jgi:transcriptional regulator with XRE-family HTH domain
MESIGQKLKAARDEKGISLDQVARDTHIAKRFISSLEEENFDVFPGDTYILGFIRNYADYLGLDAAELITRYKNLKIQEQPAPIEELLERKTPKPVSSAPQRPSSCSLPPAPFFFPQPRRRAPAPAEVKETAAHATNSGRGHRTALPAGGRSRGEPGRRVVHDPGRPIGGNVVLAGPVDRVTLKEGQEAFIELTPKGETLKVLCRSILRNEKPPKAVLHFDKYIQQPSSDIAASSAPASVQQGAGRGFVPGRRHLQRSVRIKRSQVILEALRKAPFTLEVEFRGYCRSAT